MTTNKGFIVVFPPLTLILKYCQTSPVLFTTTKEYKPAADLSICEKKEESDQNPVLKTRAKKNLVKENLVLGWTWLEQLDAGLGFLSWIGLSIVLPQWLPLVEPTYI